MLYRGDGDDDDDNDRWQWRGVGIYFLSAMFFFTLSDDFISVDGRLTRLYCRLMECSLTRRVEWRLLHTEIIFPFQIKWLFSLPVRPLLLLPLLNPFQPCSENFNFDCMFNPLRNTVRIEWANNSTWIFFDSRKNEKVLYSLAVWGGKIPAQPTTNRAISNNKMWKTESRSFERRWRFLTVQKESKKSQVLCFIR